jgi:hypothetical protein
MREPRRPLVLDLDGAVAPLPGERRIALRDRETALRFACRWRDLDGLQTALEAVPPAACGPVFTGSGDFHHVTLALLRRLRDPIDVVVLDNHPDNMRLPFGVHCASWVGPAARLPCVRRIDVLGIASSDATAWHAWEHRLRALRRDGVRYWCIGIDTRWARALGLGDRVRSFPSAERMVDAFAADQAGRTSAVYLSIDKDVLAPDVVRTNWDQGVLGETDLALALECLRGRVVGSDVTGEVSRARYRSLLKRLLVALDAQPRLGAGEVLGWQAGQHALNARLMPRLQDLYA